MISTILFLFYSLSIIISLKNNNYLNIYQLNLYMGIFFLIHCFVLSLLNLVLIRFKKIVIQNIVYLINTYLLFIIFQLLIII